MITREQAKAILKKRGWTYRTAAPRLGVCFQHLSEVLNGHRQSKRLLEKIQQLTLGPKWRLEKSKARGRSSL